jgi:hypothetical protein
MQVAGGGLEGAQGVKRWQAAHGDWSHAADLGRGNLNSTHHQPEDFDFFFVAGHRYTVAIGQ